MLTFAIDRNRRGFSTSERLLLDLFRDHVLLAYRRLVPALDAAPAGERTRNLSTLRVSREGRILHHGANAPEILARFFGPAALASSRLPPRALLPVAPRPLPLV